MKAPPTPYETQLAANGITPPCVLCQIRTEEGKRLRRERGYDGGPELFRHKYLAPRADGISNTLTGVTKDNLIMTQSYMEPTLTYRPNPTKEDLLAYFSRRIRIRKMTEREALRLMDVDDADIDRILDRTESYTLKDGTVKTRKAIAKTAAYKLAGNSIVVSCLYHIFRTMFLPNQPEHAPKQYVQPSLFPDL